MKILSALLDTAILPFSMAKDVLDASICIRKYKSSTRQRIERIEEELGL